MLEFLLGIKAKLPGEASMVSHDLIRSDAEQPWSEAAINDAAAALSKDFPPIVDMRASADYRGRVAQNCLRRLFFDLSGELAETVYGYGRAG